MDDNRSNSLDKHEFAKALKEYKMDMNAGEVQQIFEAFDTNRDGTVQYDEFLQIIRGEMNDFRKDLCSRAFQKLDADGSGVIEINDILGVYNASKHPAVIEGRKTEEQILGEFLETFETHHASRVGGDKDHRITHEEWMEYYSNVSASIDDDDYFAQMMNSSWNI